MPPAGPTLHRRQLGAELRRLRDEAGYRIEDAAKAINTSQPRLSRMETGRGRYRLRPAEVRDLCKLYGLTDKRKIESLLSLVKLSQQRGWWDEYESILPYGLGTYLGLEAEARAVHDWQPLLVTGLLQTSDYARAVLLMGGYGFKDIDDLVQVRTERQKLLTHEESPLELWAVFDEAVIRRPVGGPAVMRDQLRHLVQMTDMPNITIQVIPLSMGGNPGLGGSFTIVQFEEDSPTVYVDSQAGNIYLEKKTDIRRFTNTFDHIRAMALAPIESVALLIRAAEEMQ